MLSKIFIFQGIDSYFRQKCLDCGLNSGSSNITIPFMSKYTSVHKNNVDTYK